MQTAITDGRLFETYTCVLVDAANNILTTSFDEFADEAAAIRHAARKVFLSDAAGGYELWHRLRRVARFMKPGQGRV